MAALGNELSLQKYEKLRECLALINASLQDATELCYKLVSDPSYKLLPLEESMLQTTMEITAARRRLSFKMQEDIEEEIDGYK